MAPICSETNFVREILEIHPESETDYLMYSLLLVEIPGTPPNTEYEGGIHDTDSHSAPSNPQKRSFSLANSLRHL